MALARLLRGLDFDAMQCFLAMFKEGTLAQVAKREAVAVSVVIMRLFEPSALRAHRIDPKYPESEHRVRYPKHLNRLGLG